VEPTPQARLHGHDELVDDLLYPFPQGRAAATF
jgi:hypothetical protein